MARHAGALLALLGAALLAGALGQPSELLNNLPPPGSLSTAHYFPEHPTKQFPAGDVITAVISAHNDNSKAYNLTAIVASLNSPMDFSMFIQNFTHSVYFKELPAGQEMSLEYKFRIAPQVPTRDFFVAIHLIYEDIGGGGFFSNTVFNGTVEVVEAPKLVDTEGIFMYVMILGTAGLVGYWAFSNASDRFGIKKAAKKRSGRAAASAAAPFDEDEWVKGTPYDVDKRKRAAAGAGGKAKAT
ncbi:ssr1 [Scenedesmus sp. PABB004]|nr:ssr1 [Scenedesmus sp. PABB004]